MKTLLYVLLVYGLCIPFACAQIGMGGSPHPSAVLDLQATNKAFYLPRLTTAQRKAIVIPQPGAFVYDLDQGAFYLFDGQNWLPLAFQNPISPMPVSRQASDGAAMDYFGYSVAISGNYALVGVYNADIGLNSNQGAVYVFLRTGGTWTQEAKLTASNGAANDFFGISVAISGNYALIGAYGDDIGANADQGSAYIFAITGTDWIQQAKLTANDGAANDYFGISVAISGDYALVGAFNDDIGVNTDQGSAYPFARTGSLWTQQTRLTSSDGAGGDLFGNSVAMAGNYAVVGASGDDIGANADQGSSYLFFLAAGTWIQQAKLLAGDGTANDYFGASVAISGDYALVGANGDDIGGYADQGSAYIFSRTGSSWPQQTKLTTSSGAGNDRLGGGVAISGDYALVGADGDDIGGNNNQGSAHLYHRTGTNWAEVQLITDNSLSFSLNGTSVGLSNGIFIIGAPGFESSKGKVSFGSTDH